MHASGERGVLAPGQSRDRLHVVGVRKQVERAQRGQVVAAFGEQSDVAGQRHRVARDIDDLRRLQPAQIVYVACDPVALARDVGLFAERGYDLTALKAFDLFPHTHHVEAVATLTRR